ncbi:ABC transporter ATP-binding protein [Escherichia coli]|jgi:ABC transporter|uniref:ABC transporter n=2 Tax=Escherichia coli TaxID=562 RepID=A0A0D8W6D3_ECOLX|nr:ABC transporter ATP-binding protein [Escherichia coli]EFA4302480.1 ABC transporter ATP-binding protein [Escherichia coli O119]EFA4458355.1 ABC transporter ATP-binding protein [Escherichia coli O153]EFN7271233.1 ABC transporter ATP-binding protein [Escherichia coli O21]EFN8407995.1 ABC transporter ATP-binding protein [Escherichia coli O15]EGB64251.1 ABC transporter [Escherichia coli TA007]OSL81065.1 ferric iron uptake ABC transporter (FeT) family, ATP-binding protein [Escherichia coli TA008
MSEIALSLNDVHVVYTRSRQVVLQGFSMSVHKGELVCLLGVSGCGKTTVLRTVAGLERLQQGEIFISQRCVAGAGIHLPPEKRRVGMVFQEYALFPHLTVTQNVAFGLRHLPYELQHARVTELLKMVELLSCAKRYPHELSGGQQQRIALARALAPAPDILLLDEPFSSLDKQTSEYLVKEVRDLLRSSGQTALIVTHNESEALEISNRICIMTEGNISSVQSVV